MIEDARIASQNADTNLERVLKAAESELEALYAGGGGGGEEDVEKELACPLQLDDVVEIHGLQDEKYTQLNGHLGRVVQVPTMQDWVNCLTDIRS